MLRPHLDERQRRLLLGVEAQQLGRGGIKAIADATRVHPDTVSRGVREVEGVPEPVVRVRAPGGGRKKLTETDPQLLVRLKMLVDPETRGDPMSLLVWTSKSTRNLAEALSKMGHQVSDRDNAVDEVRRRVVAEFKAASRHEQAASLKGSRWALLKNMLNLTGAQKTTLASIQRDNKVLYRAYLLKEQLRYVFQATNPSQAKSLLAGWLAWVKRSRIPEFTKVAATVEKMRDLIWNTLRSGGLSNAVVEATNNHFRLLTRRAYGYHSAETLIAMSELMLGGLCPPLPGRP